MTFNPFFIDVFGHFKKTSFKKLIVFSVLLFFTVLKLRTLNELGIDINV